MILTQHYLGCLSQASYLIGDDTSGRAIVVDPRRDVAIYLEEAQRRGLRIELIIETHVHADFLSGHLELAAATGAAIGYGDAAVTDFEIRRLRDGERLVLGEVEVEVRATPGHTPESISLVVHERSGGPPSAVLTGDTLFIGDVGRPDLVSSVGGDATEMARMLYRSIQQQLLTLPDDTLVYPGHGAGSSCGRSLSEATVSTIGEQRQANAALRADGEAEFVGMLIEGQPPAPQYFRFDAELNRRRRDTFDPGAQPPALSAAEVDELTRAGAIVLDIRSPEEFSRRHLRGAVNIGLDGRFAEYAGCMLEPERPLILSGDDDRFAEARLRLARIGFDSVAGVLRQLERVLDGDPASAASARRLSAAELARRLDDGPPQIIDIRMPSEREGGVIPGARPMPLAELRMRLGELDGARPMVVYCAGGFRSAAGASLMRQRGFGDVMDLEGGYDAWLAAGRATVTG